MTNLELFTVGRRLEQAGWKWETWSGSFTTSDAKGWWFLSGAEGAQGMRRGDPKLYDLATVSTYKLYVEKAS